MVLLGADVEDDGHSLLEKRVAAEWSMTGQPVSNSSPYLKWLPLMGREADLNVCALSDVCSLTPQVPF